jgi:hypothetical protein
VQSRTHARTHARTRARTLPTHARPSTLLRGSSLPRSAVASTHPCATGRTRHRLGTAQPSPQRIRSQSSARPRPASEWRQAVGRYRPLRCGAVLKTRRTARSFEKMANWLPTVVSVDLSNSQPKPTWSVRLSACNGP